MALSNVCYWLDEALQRARAQPASALRSDFQRAWRGPPFSESLSMFLWNTCACANYSMMHEASTQLFLFATKRPSSAPPT